MLALLGFLTVVIFLVLIMTKRVSVTLALIVVPVVAALIGGFAPKMGPMMINGIKNVAPVGVMIMFAILYFGLMLEVGLFEPIVRRLLKIVGGDPLKVVLATAFLTCSVSLDGDGATTFMITISAMLPLYKALNMSRLVLSGTICLAAGVMNIIPWGGPTARAMTVLKADSAAIFNPVIPAMIAGLVWVFFVAWYFGKKERARVGIMDVQQIESPVLSEEESALRRPNLLWFNAVLTAALVVALIQAILPLATLFMIAYAIALIVNFPQPKQQLERITAQGSAIVLVCSMIFAAGIFTGILTGTDMIKEMSKVLVTLIPAPMTHYLPVIVALTSMPFSLIFTPDAYYFGVLPILAQTATAIGIDPLHIGRAAILGQMTTGFPLSPLTASTFILIGMSGVELGEHQRFVFKWAFGSTVVMTVVAVLTGAISFVK
ncbi:CitMHS family transporter [Propionivibrio dicarboxylicus]|uniref:Citrate-Mg2+:H+ or citrate-Ca2+:H+ symporter, CitMHS family n=1 Tax=Propionivibrio dicarboxylicus TaxID=83767 RepID=A0A1G8J4D3_9RHOO|nr:citrate:proton symporter [Propionivibrio dicarboxylicus]SDI25837.1 citrate-Mg2+:H+ or citrate-Ca2+:H+ symporter, CitMHS family [Propionivibrio dicarboxylicus]